MSTQVPMGEPNLIRNDMLQVPEAELQFGSQCFDEVLLEQQRPEEPQSLTGKIGPFGIQRAWRRREPHIERGRKQQGGQEYRLGSLRKNEPRDSTSTLHKRRKCEPYFKASLQVSVAGSMYSLWNDSSSLQLSRVPQCRRLHVLKHRSTQHPTLTAKHIYKCHRRPGRDASIPINLRLYLLVLVGCSSMKSRTRRGRWGKD